MTNDEAVKICEPIWKRLKKMQTDDAWSILAMVVERFCREVEDGDLAREAFIDWLRHTQLMAECRSDGPLH